MAQRLVPEQILLHLLQRKVRALGGLVVLLGEREAQDDDWEVIECWRPQQAASTLYIVMTTTE